MRRAARVDVNQSEVVLGLRAAGILVFIIKEPCDILTYQPAKDVWKPLEIKKPGFVRPRKDQEKQNRFLRDTKTPIVRNALEALQALGLMRE